MRLLPLIASLFCISTAQAFTVDMPLQDKKQEARAQEIFQEIRCVVCQGQSLADSPSQIAADMRREIRKQVVAGESNEKILIYLEGRYGKNIRMRPIFLETPALWLAPLAFLLIGLTVAAFYFRRQRA